MSLHRYAKRRDGAEAAIVEALERAGATVWRLDLPCDLLVQFRGLWMTMEVKTPQGKRATTKQDRRQGAQRDFLVLTRTPIVKTPQEALQALWGQSQRAAKGGLEESLELAAALAEAPR